jgi:hypothetical protein
MSEHRVREAQLATSEVERPSLPIGEQVLNPWRNAIAHLLAIPNSFN